MDIDRRSLLTGMFPGADRVLGASTRALRPGQPIRPSLIAGTFLTRSLLDRAIRARNRPDRPRVECVIRERAAAQGFTRDPVIKWLADPGEAFHYLSRYGHRELLQMPATTFWRGARPDVVDDEEVLERTFDLRMLASEILRVDDHDRALMAPKLLAKRAADVLAGATAFESRGVAAQVGWLETSLPAAAAEVMCVVEVLLCSGFPERSKPIYHQLMVFEAYDAGLLATWETPAELVCVPLI